MNRRHFRIPQGKRQEGAVLVVVLVLLLVMTLLGLASLRGTVMEERMSGSMRDRSMAFQAAEAAMREAEALIFANGSAGFPAAGSATCSGNLCDTPDPNNAERWRNRNGAYWRDAAVNVGAPAIRPQYFIEYMGDAPSWPKCDSEIPVHALCMKPRYRITARSTDDVDARAQVILQGNYAGS
jgi:type IV pilus assembly protein PilX